MKSSAADRVESASKELADLMRTLADRAHPPNLYVVAHSMGNRVLARAIERITAELAPFPASSRTLVLAAPDVNQPQFAAVSGSMTRLFQRRTVYVSDTDIALQVSRIVNNEPRVGQRHPLGIGGEFEIVDATGARDSIIGNSSFVDYDSIALDIAKAALQAIPAEKRGLSSTQDGDKIVWRLPQ